jgi:polyhydroxyalkanoate synthesis regulator protein
MNSMPNMMGDYLEKSASSVIGMQEELRKQAMQMFSSFPYGKADGRTDSGGAGAARAESEADEPANEPVKAKASATKSRSRKAK